MDLVLLFGEKGRVVKERTNGCIEVAFLASSVPPICSRNCRKSVADVSPKVLRMAVLCWGGILARAGRVIGERQANIKAAFAKCLSEAFIVRTFLSL